MCHMKRVSIRELHQQTGHWVRLAAHQPIVVTDRGRPVATIVPVQDEMLSKPLPDREKELSKLPKIPVDSAEVISADRQRA